MNLENNCQKFGSTKITCYNAKRPLKYCHEIKPVTQDPEEMEKLFNMCCIYQSHGFSAGVRIKTAYFKHSCQPNASTISVGRAQGLEDPRRSLQFEIRAT